LPPCRLAHTAFAPIAKARRTVKQPEVRVGKHEPMESLRAHSADTLCGFNATALSRYEAGFEDGFKEFARMLHPAGYHPDRSRSELIAGLRKPSTKCTMASLQHLKAVRDMLDSILKGIADDPTYPFDDRFLCGFEDAHWILLGLLDPSVRAPALRYLYQNPL
jgi:hypothetical protein